MLLFSGVAQAKPAPTDDTGKVVVFFDIGDTLGKAVISRSPLKILRIDMFDFVKPLLKRLRAQNIRIGIISNTIPGDSKDVMKKLLQDSGIYEFFEPSLLLYSSVEGIRKNSPEIFKRAAQRAGFLQKAGELYLRRRKSK